MLTIHAPQWAALRDSRIAAFERRTLDHLQHYFPRHVIAFGVDPMRKLIDLGLAASSGYGLRSEACVRTYVELTLLFGVGFPDDPLTPWAQRILVPGDADGRDDELARGDRLHAEAWNFIDACRLDLRGSADVLSKFQAELNHVKGLGDRLPSSVQSDELARSLVGRLTFHFPSKCGYVGEERVLVQVSSGLDRARACHLETLRGLATFATLGFVLGHDFMNDPLHEWASSQLRSQAPEALRVDGVLSRASALLDRWWRGDPAVTVEG